MKALLQITTWVWWTIVIVSALVSPSVIGQAATNYTTVTYNFANNSTSAYASFVASVRNAVKGTKVSFGLPVTMETVDVSKRFVLVPLKNFDAQKSITLGIDVLDLYVVGYLDKYNNKDRANFLSDIPAVARENLFKEADVRNFTFTGSYLQLERNAGTGRQNIALGVVNLKKAANATYGLAPTAGNTAPATFLIIAIQMVSESARFKYILTKALANGDIYGSYKPDPKAISLETSWQTISTAIQTANTTTGQFSSTVALSYENGSRWEVNNVNQIKDDMGLLKFYKA